MDKRKCIFTFSDTGTFGSLLLLRFRSSSFALITPSKEVKIWSGLFVRFVGLFVCQQYDRNKTTCQIFF